MKKNKTSGKRNNALKAARYGLLVALALVLSYAEAQLPVFFAFPGMKLGLTNIVVLLALYKMGSGSSMAVNILRIILVSLLFGGFSPMLYSLAGGMLSTAVMIILKKTDQFSIIAVSAAGGIAHNIGQIIVAMFVVNTSGIVWYLAVLWISGIVSGIIIGVIGAVLVKRLPQSLFD